MQVKDYVISKHKKVITRTMILQWASLICLTFSKSKHKPVQINYLSTKVNKYRNLNLKINYLIINFNLLTRIKMLFRNQILMIAKIIIIRWAADLIMRVARYSSMNIIVQLLQKMPSHLQGLARDRMHRICRLPTTKSFNNKMKTFSEIKMRSSINLEAWTIFKITTISKLDFLNIPIPEQILASLWVKEITCNHWIQ